MWHLDCLIEKFNVIVCDFYLLKCGQILYNTLISKIIVTKNKGMG